MPKVTQLANDKSQDSDQSAFIAHVLGSTKGELEE